MLSLLATTTQGIRPNACGLNWLSAKAKFLQRHALIATSTLAFLSILPGGDVKANGLNSDTTTFSAQVSESCSMPLGDTTQEMTYVGDDNRFWKSVPFSLTANQAVRLSVSAVSVLDEPQNIQGRYAWARIQYPSSVGSSSTSLPAPTNIKTGTVATAGEAFSANNQTDVSTNYTLNFQVGTTGRSNGRHLLLPGQYRYQVTVTCLL